MRKRWLVPILLVGFQACLLPEYSFDPPGGESGASGASAAASGTAGDGGATGNPGAGGSTNAAGNEPMTTGAAGGEPSVDAGGMGGNGGTTAGSSAIPDGGVPNAPDVCSASQKDCAGACVEIDDPAYGCTAASCNQSECPTGAASYACDQGACVIATCPAQTKLCDGRCVAVADPTYGCSADACDGSVCPNPGANGALVCSGSSCLIGTCVGQTKKCGNACVPLDANNGCATPGSCTRCEANETCAGSPSACACVPDNAKACQGIACGSATNNCGDEVDCPDTCTAPYTCGAGSADDNHCGLNVPTGSSNGCGTTAPSGNSSGYTLRDINVTGVSSAYITANPPAASTAPYTWTHRNYFIKLPVGYDKATPYPVVLQGGGCGNTDGRAGASGGFSTLPNGQSQAIQIGLSYVFPQTAGACFADDTALTPELAYFDAVLADLKANYCIDLGRVFSTGFSSGAFEALTFGCGRAGVLRGLGAASGRVRTDRPACSGFPVAAMVIHGADDANITPAQRQATRDDLLQRNGCSGSQSAAWDSATYPECLEYVNCPAAYPVVWCVLAGQGTTAGGTYGSQGIWKFFSELPPGG